MSIVETYFNNSLGKLNPLRNSIKLALSIIFLFIGSQINGQVLFQESFNVNDGMTNGSANGVNWSSSCPDCVSGDYWETKNGFFEGRDTNGEAVWENVSPIDISNCGNIEINFDIESVGSMEDCNTGCNSVDWVRFQYNIDGTGWTDPSNSYMCAGQCAGFNVVTSGDTPFMNYTTGCIPTTGSNLQIRISVQAWSGSEYWRIDDITVSCGGGNAGTNASITLCNTASSTNLFNELGGNPDNNGTWSGPSMLTNGNSGTFDPSTMTVGTYTYTVGSGNCQTSSTVDVTINSTGNTGTNASIALCNTASSTDLFNELGGNPDNNGTWTGPSSLNNGNLGTFDPSTMTAGTYTYTVGSGSCQASSTVDVTVNSTGNAGTNNTISLCDVDLPVDLFNQLGGNPDNNGFWSGPSALTNGNLGTFDPSTMTAGTYTYTVGSGNCQTSSTVAVTVNTTGNAGTNNTVTLCSNAAAINLHDKLGGNPDNSGIWTGPSNLANGSSGNFDPAAMNAGIYTYTVGTGNCQTNASVEVIINPTGNAGTGNTLSLCDNTSSVNLFNELGGNPDNNGVWTGPSTLTNGNSGTFDPATMNGGVYTYTIENGNCVATSTVSVTLNNAPNAQFSSNKSTICANEEVQFSSGNINSVNCFWDFGDGNTSTSCNNTSNLYSTEGIYDVSLTVTDLNGCISSHTESNMIEVLPTPKAKFTTETKSIPVGEVTVDFINQSENANTYQWNFGDESPVESDFDAIHYYTVSTQDNFIITLTATNNAGCSDSFSIQIDVENEVTYFVPNAFTPNGDFDNETFKPSFNLDFKPDSYDFLIYNRWGELLFESHDPQVGWDGTYLNNVVQSGTYIWIMRFSNENDINLFTEKGSLTVIK
ncbi:PKD domain-containing protein [Brumimicrobium aurantiacum]|uniref:PKD domain-containing protein n=1 Tax=Brumimicrobium aurantiacum TaxID=1737063 RepID=A0A3E1EZV9_9FLAO|nr:PKD domain-containing protein [Brumimicrobium aurantiacum]RFC55094.1 PKD domain-containing protein [Brumimicrobium aurantiacum]